LILKKKKLVAICLDAPKSGAFKHTRCCKFEQKLIPSFSRGLPKFSPFVMHKGNKRWTEKISNLNKSGFSGFEERTGLIVSVYRHPGILRYTIR